MKTRFTAVCLALALGAVPQQASAQLKLGGSDSWEPIVRGFFADTTREPGADLVSFIDWGGGGQSAGETPLKSSATSHQVISVFTAQLTDTGANSVCATFPNATDIVTGIDGILVVGNAGHFAGNPQLGGTSGTWQNALTTLFLGYDIPSGVQDCNSTARRSLANDYASLFTGSSIPANTPIKHVFRRGDTTGTSKAFLQLLGVPTANQKYCNGTDVQDIDPIRRAADATDQVAEYDGTLGLVLDIIVPTFSNNATDLYLGGNGTSPSTFGKFAGANGPVCSGAPSPIDLTTAAAGVAPTSYPGIAATVTNITRCDCRYPVPANFSVPTSDDAKRFNWNVKLGSGCLVPQAAAAPLFGVLNGDDGTRDNTPVTWGNRVPNTVLPSLPTAQRCCNVGTSFRREDPRSVNLWVRAPATGNLQPGNGAGGVAPVLATYRLAATNKGLSNVGKTGATARCQQVFATDLQISCLVTSVPGEINSIGTGALTIYKDNVANGLPLPTAFNANTDPIVSDYSTVRDRSYGLSRYVFLSSVLGFDNLGESIATHTGDLTTFNYDSKPGTAPGTTQQQIDAQYNLAKAIYADSKRPDRSNALVETKGFLALPAGTDPYGVACSGDANSVTATKIDLSNTFNK